VTRVGVYANTKSIRMKSAEELEELRENGLGIAYMGVESGDDETLAAVRKGATAQGMIAAGRKIRQAGIKLSITVLLGIGGRTRSMVHAQATGRVISAIDPEFVGALSLMLIPGTPLHDAGALRTAAARGHAQGTGSHDCQYRDVRRLVPRQSCLQLSAAQTRDAA